MWVKNFSSVCVLWISLVNAHGVKMALGATHMPVLLTVMLHTQGPVLEMGCGHFSTPLLSAVCAPYKRSLVTAENDPAWMKLFVDMTKPWHQFVFVKTLSDWASVGRGQHWNVVFIDHWPANQRAKDIERLRKDTDIFVAHDAENIECEYDKILPSFKYQFVYKRYFPWTAVVSDAVDVARFFQE